MRNEMETTEPEELSIGSEALRDARIAEERAVNLITLLRNKIEPILIQESSPIVGELANELKAGSQIPDYFKDLRDSNRRLNVALDDLESIIYRIGL